MSQLEELIARVKNEGITPEFDEETIYRIVEKMRKENKTLQEVCGIDDEVLEEIYQIAYHHYNSGKYQDAANLFIFLQGVASKTYKFSFGLASSYYQLHDYPNALLFYCYASITDTSCPLAPYYASDTLIKLGRKEEALQALDYAMQLMEGKEHFSPLLERCRLIKERLSLNEKVKK